MTEDAVSQLRAGCALIPPPGSALPPLDKPRFTPTNIVRRMAAQQFDSRTGPEKICIGG